MADIEEKQPKFILPDSPLDFLRDLVEVYPSNDTVTLNKIIGIGKVKYQDEELLAGMPMTAAVINTKPYTLLFGKKFMEENMQTIEDAVYILSHELTHLVLDHFAPDIVEEFKEKELGFKAAHIIVDCQVNATVYNSLKEEKYLEFIKRFYPKDKMPYCFFRPDGEPDTEELKALHAKLFSEDGITNKELIEGLTPWFDQQDNQSLDDVVNNLLGNHRDTFKDRGGDLDNPELNDLAQGVAESYLKKNNKKLEEAIKDLTKDAQEEQQSGRQAGSGGTPREETIQKFIDSIDYLTNIKNKLKKKEVISPSSRIYKAIADYLPKTPVRTVIPNFHDRRTTSIYAKTKKTPIFHKAPKIGSKVIVPCYLDVSGSQSHVIPYTTQAVILLKKEIGNVVYCFSTIISETTINSLQQGKYTTDGGTDFNPVVEHILKNKFKRAVILTDGEAGLSNNLIERLKRAGVKITVVWTISNPSKRPLNQIAEKELYLFEKDVYTKDTNSF